MNLEGGRVDEIKMWLTIHAWKEDIKWVGVDDLNMSAKFDAEGNKIGGLDNFVWCPKSQEGIKQIGVKEKILELLK